MCVVQAGHVAPLPFNNGRADMARHALVGRSTCRTGDRLARRGATARIVDLTTRQVTAVLPHPSPVTSVEFSPDARTLITGANDGTARVWPIAAPEWRSAPDDRTLGVVDFSIFPHLDAFPSNTLADARRWAADIGHAAYAIDEQTAIKVVDGSVDVVTEGQWTKFGA
jgi:WD40 repeat protein